MDDAYEIFTADFDDEIQLHRLVSSAVTDNMTRTMKKEKKNYERMTIVPIAIEPGSLILSGSVTEKSIRPEIVEVEDYSIDTTFPVDGFDTSFE